MRVIFQEPDMDTALTAFILGVSEEDEIVCLLDRASEADLADPRVLCIEAGGSGQPELLNFDHHDGGESLPPACQQALEQSPGRTPELERLVRYVSAIDVGGHHELPAVPPDSLTLSRLFSGLRLSNQDPRATLLQGMDLFRLILEDGLDPTGPLPHRPEWAAWIKATEEEGMRLAKDMEQAQLVRSGSGRLIGFVETDAVGALGALFRLGCQVGIAYSPAFGHTLVPKFTIGGGNRRVDSLLPHLRVLESGWGGPTHGTVIASPRTGSRLHPDTLLELVVRLA